MVFNCWIIIRQSDNYFHEHLIFANFADLLHSIIENNASYQHQTACSTSWVIRKIHLNMIHIAMRTILWQINKTINCETMKHYSAFGKMVLQISSQIVDCLSKLNNEQI